MSCIIPTENYSVFQFNRERLLPAFSAAPRQISPTRTGIFRFIGVALSICGGLVLATLLLVHFLPGWRDFILFVGLMSMIPAMLFLIVRILEFATSGFSKNGMYYTMRYSKGFYLHTVVIPVEKVVLIEIRQSPLQQPSPNCDLIVRTRAEGHFSHRCRNLNKVQLEQILKL